MPTKLLKRAISLFLSLFVAREAADHKNLAALNPALIRKQSLKQNVSTVVILLFLSKLYPTASVTVRIKVILGLFLGFHLWWETIKSLFFFFFFTNSPTAIKSRLCVETPWIQVTVEPFPSF